jgi:hypothetical protein
LDDFVSKVKRNHFLLQLEEPGVGQVQKIRWENQQQRGVVKKKERDREIDLSSNILLYISIIGIVSGHYEEWKERFFFLIFQQLIVFYVAVR